MNEDLNIYGKIDEFKIQKPIGLKETSKNDNISDSDESLSFISNDDIKKEINEVFGYTFFKNK